MKYNLTLLSSTSLPAKRQGWPLEIVPLIDPLTLRQGQRLPVLVLADSKPLVGARVLADFIGDTYAKGVKTDKQGKAMLAVRSSGLNVVAVSHTRPRTDKSVADEDGYEATLAFTLRQGQD